MAQKTTNKYVALFCFMVIISGCGSNETKKESNSSTDSSGATGTETKAVDAKLICRSLGEDSLATPHADVILSVNGQEKKIAAINSCAEIPRSDYKTYEIPDNALSAVGGFWAGLGSYFYVVWRDGKAVVFEGWQEESQKEKGYHWKELTQ